MFKNTLVTLILLPTFLMVQAQHELTAALGRLERDSLITARENRLLLQQYQEYAARLDKMRRSDPSILQQETPDYSQPYELLALLVQAKTFSTPGAASDLFFAPAPASSRHMPRAAIRAELDTFIHRLDRSGLLSAWSFQDLRRMNEKDQFDWELSAAQRANVIANQEYFLRPEKLKVFADSLHSAKVIGDDNYRLLMEKSSKGQLHQFSELTAYLNFSVGITWSELPRDTTAFLDSLYAISATVLPGLRYDSISFRVEKDKQESFDNFTAYNLVTTIRFKDRSYRYSGYYYSLPAPKGKGNAPHLPDAYFEVFNKVLEDRGASYRLHSVTIDKNRFGLIALTEDQFKLFTWTYDRFTLNGKQYRATLHHKLNWMDPAFWELIDSAEKASDLRGRFYYIFPSDGLTEIYLTNGQYGYLRLHGLLEFEDPEAGEGSGER